MWLRSSGFHSDQRQTNATKMCENKRQLCEEVIYLLPLNVHSLANKVMDDETIGEPIVWLRHTMEDFVDKQIVSKCTKIAIDFNSNQILTDCEQMSVNCDIIIDKMWETINCLDWTRVGLDFRCCFAYASLLKAIIQLWSTLAITDSDKVFEIGLTALKTLDLALLMSPKLEPTNCLAKVAKVVHKWLMDCSSGQRSEQHTMTMSQKRKSSDCDLSCDETKIIRSEQKSGSEEDLDHFEYSIPYFSNQPKNRIKRVKDLSLDEFRDNYLLPKVPVIITDCMNDWPAMSDRKWSVDYIRRVAAYRTVPIEIGSKYTDEEWSQKLLTIKQFIRDFIINSEPDRRTGYLAQHNLFDQIEEFMADISVPDYCSVIRDEETDNVCDVDINGWFGPSATVSPLHYDPKDNLLAQVFGQKYVRLYSDRTSPESIYPNDCRLLFNTSRVDLENVDPVRFDKFLKLDDYHECVINSGEMLFIPHNYWHFVKSLSNSFSISFWWK